LADITVISTMPTEDINDLLDNFNELMPDGLMPEGCELLLDEAYRERDLEEGELEEGIEDALQSVVCPVINDITEQAEEGSESGPVILDVVRVVEDGEVDEDITAARVLNELSDKVSTVLRLRTTPRICLDSTILLELAEDAENSENGFPRAPLSNRRLLLEMEDPLTPTTTTPGTATHSPRQVTAKVHFSTMKRIHCTQTETTNDSEDSTEDSDEDNDHENSDEDSVSSAPIGYVHVSEPDTYKLYRLYGGSVMRRYYLDGFDNRDRTYYRKHGKPRLEGGRTTVEIRSYQVTWVGEKEVRQYEPVRRLQQLWPVHLHRHIEFMKKVRAKDLEDNDDNWKRFCRIQSPRSRTAAANGTHTCVIDAIRVACQLLGQPTFATEDRVGRVIQDKFGEYPANGLKRSQLYAVFSGLNDICRTRSEPTVMVAMKEDNLIRNCVSGMLRFDIGEGVYMAAGFGFEGPGHSFVVHVKKNVRYMYDPRVHDGPMAWQEANFNWILVWQYLLKVTVQITYKRKRHKVKHKRETKKQELEEAP
jgi:hypothetical protein